jgi:hypothetical protein
MDAVRKQSADRAAGTLADWLVERLNEPWLEMETGKDGYKTTPKVAEKLTHYDEILAKVPANLNHPHAVSVTTTGFLTSTEARTVSGIGSARFSGRQGLAQTLAMLAFRNKALVPTIPDDAQDRQDYLALHQTARYPLKDTMGNLYLFRVIEARDSHPPDTLEEVREKIVTNLRLKKGYDAAKTRAESLRQAALQAKGLKEAFDADAELNELKTSAGVTYVEPDPFARVRESQAASGRTSPRTFVPILGNVPNEVVDQLFALEFAAEKIETFELPDRASVMAAEWVESRRGREDEFEALRATLAAGLAKVRQDAAVRDWLDPEKIRLRNGFQAAPLR